MISTLLKANFSRVFFCVRRSYPDTSRRQKRSSWLSSARGDSPQCGEMSRRDKRAGHPLKVGASCPLQSVDNKQYQKSKRRKETAVRHSRNKKLLENECLRKIHRQFGQRNSGEQPRGKERSDFVEPHATRFPRQAGDVPQPCRTGFRWYPKVQFACSGKEQSDFADPYAARFPKIHNPPLSLRDTSPFRGGFSADPYAARFPITGFHFPFV